MPLLKFFFERFLHFIIHIDTLCIGEGNKGYEHVHQYELHRGDKDYEQKE